MAPEGCLDTRTPPTLISAWYWWTETTGGGGWSEQYPSKIWQQEKKTSTVAAIMSPMWRSTQCSKNRSCVKKKQSNRNNRLTLRTEKMAKVKRGGKQTNQKAGCLLKNQAFSWVKPYIPLRKEHRQEVISQYSSWELFLGDTQGG